MGRGFSYFFVIILLLFSAISWGDDLDQVLNEAKEALKNPVTIQDREPAQNKAASADTALKVNSRAIHKKFHLKKVAKTSQALSERDKNGEVEKNDEASDNVTAPLPSTEAHQVLDIDIKALTHEQEPQDPRFTVYFDGGFYTASPSFTLYKDDDAFSLRDAASLAGGTLTLETSWGLTSVLKNHGMLKALLQGGAGVYTGSADVTRQGVDNSNESYEYYIIPIDIGVGLGLEWNHFLTFSATYGPSLHLVSQKGSGQDDTLSGAFSSDQLNLGLTGLFTKGWEGQIKWIDNGLLNQNVKGQGILVGLGFRISG